MGDVSPGVKVQTLVLKFLLFTVLFQSIAAMIAVAPTARWRSSMTTLRRRWFIQVNGRLGDRAGDSIFAIVFGCFLRIKKMLGRTETRNRERKCFQSMRTV